MKQKNLFGTSLGLKVEKQWDLCQASELAKIMKMSLAVLIFRSKGKDYIIVKNVLKSLKIKAFQ